MIAWLWVLVAGLELDELCNKLLGGMFEGGDPCCSATQAHNASCDMWLALLSCRSA